MSLICQLTSEDIKQHFTITVPSVCKYRQWPPSVVWTTLVVVVVLLLLLVVVVSQW